MEFNCIKFPYRYQLSTKEVSTLKWLAYARGAHKASWGPRFTKATDMTSDEVVSCKSHYMGLAGEYVTSKITGGFFDPMPTFLGDKDKADIRVGNDGIKIACKTTKYDPPHLKLTSMKEVADASHIALCLFQDPIVTVHWIKSKEYFMGNYYTHDYGYGTRYCLA